MQDRAAVFTVVIGVKSKKIRLVGRSTFTHRTFIQWKAAVTCFNFRVYLLFLPQRHCTSKHILTLC